MLGTVICSAFYMWYNKIPQPFGAPSVRPLLLLRGIAGFFGVFGLYYSLMYLPLSEATVLTFLAPILCCYACSLVIPGEVFTRKQQIAGVVSLLGVILIARPRSLFASELGDSPDGTAAVTS
jgi:drug/metabolite transporter (DMT)-like permease